MEISTEESRRLLLSGILIGVALSGFFDGILLHQILQWHHLLSLVPGAFYQDPRVQVAADGVFHALMYGLAILGGVLLWRGPDRRRSSDSALWRSVALGFGGWNIFDIVVFHWVLGWHHVRLDTDVPIAWDGMWLVVFGVLPVAIGAMRRPPRVPGRRQGRTRAFLTLVVFGAAVWAAGTPKGAATVVLFRPGATDAEVMGAIASSDARLVASDPTGQLVAIELPNGSAGWGLYRHGALLVSSAGPAGCASSSRL